MSGSRQHNRVSPHVCFTYTSDEEFADAAVAFLADGRARGERMQLVADATAAELRSLVDPLGDVDALVASGALLLQPPEELYAFADAFSAEDQLDAYARATERALADGFTGLCTVADVTAVVAVADIRPEFARWEHFVERYIASHPCAGLCAYDRRVLGDAVAEFTCVHPVAHAPEDLVTFQLFATADGTLALAGEVERANVDRFRRVLAMTPRQADIVLDFSATTYFDQHGLDALEYAAIARRPTGARVRVTSAPEVVTRLAAMLGADRVVEFEAAAG